MTRKIALSLALLATVGMTGCTVDAPTPEDFNYSFLEELPDATAGFSELPLRSPADSHIVVSFGDGFNGVGDAGASVSEVALTVRSVQASFEDEDGATRWRTLSTTPVELDLLQLADGSLQDVVDGPFSEGPYTGLAIVLEDAWVVEPQGKKSRLELPGRVLHIEEDFRLDSGAATEIVVNLGGLRGLSMDVDGWSMEPDVSYAVDSE